ncbi:hypothetical protein FG386_003447 [Cryptosporidium ryanae]|uniref:uncharacterized protein n=1 Tax=Cryptosporidium ryanae TaxID=515981 RepID=UPI00351A447A|nr:hypothetical protein FG386_003447 [Cryptosporidium ryanae]
MSESLKNSLGVGHISSDSTFNIDHRHHIELLLSESEIDEWERDVKNVNPETYLKICDINKYMDADDAVEVSKVDSIQYYHKEAIETQLNIIERLINLNGRF